MRYYFILLLSFVPFLCSPEGQTKGKKENEKDMILFLIKKAADWQLKNPSRIDLYFRDTLTGQFKEAQILWDGTLMRVLQANHIQEKGERVPREWTDFGTFGTPQVNCAILSEPLRKTAEKLIHSSVPGSTSLFIGDAGSHGWEMAPFLMALSELCSVSPSDRYSDAILSVGSNNKWKLGDRIFHADDHAVGQAYLFMYEKNRNPEMKADLQMHFDWIINQPQLQGMKYSEGKNRWTWCDALFMSPPAWVRLSVITGDWKYLNYMNEEWWLTTGHLYDKAEQLFYRDDRFIGMKDTKGNKIFWSRGNGWVMAALARILSIMPDSFHDKEKYILLYREMACRIAGLQPPDGMFRTSLLGQEIYPNPESSSTAFFCYALAWGINNNLIDKEKYGPVVKKSWKALTRCLDENGKLGYVQLPGSEPGAVEKSWNAAYGTGAFILAGCEMMKMLDN